MYSPDTVLALKEPKSQPETKKGAGDAVVFPYDRVRVIGPSPIAYGGGASEWEGVNARGVIIAPLTEFAGNLDEPFGRLQRLYDVESEPEPQDVQVHERAYDAHSRVAGKTPEESLQELSGDVPKSATRVRTQHSPLQTLDEASPPESESPLGRVDDERQRLAPERQ